MAKGTWIGQLTTKPMTATVKTRMAYYIDSPTDRFVEDIEEEPKAHVRTVLGAARFDMIRD